MRAGLKGFIALCEAMESDDFELTVEEFSVVYAAFKRLQAGGAPFDAAFVERMEALNREGRGCDDDSDRDDADERIDTGAAPAWAVREARERHAKNKVTRHPGSFLAEDRGGGLTH